jgi:hypothetical protein
MCTTLAYQHQRLHLQENGANIGAMNDLATLTDLIENLIRLGTIATVQMKLPRLQVNPGTLTTR